jgi:hypothetical protein
MSADLYNVTLVLPNVTVGSHVSVKIGDVAKGLVTHVALVGGC